jgi:soluble lytic murein transglycosylase-like protein
MRRPAASCLLMLAVLVAPQPAFAGAQDYEELADSVRAALSAAIRDRAAPTLQFDDPEDGHKWLFEMSNRLSQRIPDRASRIDLLKTVHYEATRAGLDPQVVLSIVDVESAFRKYAVSSAGARGYMQVMPFWLKLIGRSGHNLFHLRTNLRYGCVILRHYLDIENGDYFRALGRYNGSLGKPDYPNLVMAAWKNRWAYEAPVR